MPPFSRRPNCYIVHDSQLGMEGTGCCLVQVLRFDLNVYEPDPTTIDLSTAVAGGQFEPITVRVVSSRYSGSPIIDVET